jgi:predicted RNA-binding Zn-ribbon protein involved in translation (DUF1610 family)
MPRRFNGPWDNYPLLHRLMDEGAVYVECVNCGAHIQSWVTVMSGECFKCGREHGIHRRKARLEAEDAARRRRRLESLYGFLKNEFLRGHACSYRSAGELSGSGNHVTILEGEHAWDSFIDLIVLNSRYTAFRCPACRFLHVLQICGDINVASGHFHVMPTVGVVRDANHWTASFVCGCCGRSASVKAMVSLDLLVTGKRVGNPLRIGWLRWWWLSLFNAVPHERCERAR